MFIIVGHYCRLLDEKKILNMNSSVSLKGVFMHIKKAANEKKSRNIPKVFRRGCGGKVSKFEL